MNHAAQATAELASGGSLAFDLDVMAAARRYNRHLARHIVRTMGASEPLLDFGAGTGNIADEVLAEIGTTPLCIEPDPSFQTVLREKGFPVRTLDELEDGKAEGLYSCNVLEHIADDAHALAQAVAKVRVGAPVFVYVPAFPLLFGQWDRDVGHHRRYTRSSLRRTLERAGVRVWRSGYTDSLGFLAAGTMKLLGRGVRVTQAKVEFYDRHLFPWSQLLDHAARPWFGKNAWAAGTRA